MCWFAAYTKPRSEFRALDYFAKCKVNAYVPEYTEKRVWSDRIKKTRIPAVSGYVFFELNSLNYDLVNQNPYVRNVVKAFGFPVEISDTEITCIKNYLKNYTESIELKKGGSMLIESGPFKTNVGVVESFDNNSVTLLISSIKLKLALSECKVSLMG